MAKRLAKWAIKKKENVPLLRRQNKITKEQNKYETSSDVVARLTQQGVLDVRHVLVARLGILLPGLSEEEHTFLYAFTVQALGSLALEDILQIRLALSSTFKDQAFMPPKLASELTQELELSLSEPMMRYYTSLPDDSLLALLIFFQEKLVAKGKGAILSVRKNDDGLILSDLDFTIKKLDEALLSRIVQNARQINTQNSLSSQIYQGFSLKLSDDLYHLIDQGVRNLVLGHAGLDYMIVEEIVDVFRRRFNFIRYYNLFSGSVEKKAYEMFRAGKLSEEMVCDALALRLYDFVYSSISLLLSVETNVVREIFSAQSARPIVALCWKLGLSMRTAFLIQRDLCNLQPRNLIYPKDGTDYPLSLAELEWTLEFLGLKMKSPWGVR